jgi:cytochrome c553
MNIMKIVAVLMMANIAFAASTQEVYTKKCKTCHGPSGENTAVGKSKPIKDMSVVEIETAITNLASGERKGLPVAKSIKKNFIDTHTKEQVHALAEYINQL